MMDRNGTQDDSKLCDHCHQHISNANWVMHEARCRRINVVCPECHEVVLRDNLDGHKTEYHTMEPCELCNKPVERWLLEKHKSEECWKRSIVCSYCKTEVSLSDFSEHEHACGSRTDQCYICHKYIMLKNMEEHLWEKHGEGSGPAVPHNSPTHERKGGGSDGTNESHFAKTNTMFGGLTGAAPAPRKMGVSQPARKKEKPQAGSDVNLLNQPFGQLSVSSREGSVSSLTRGREDSPQLYGNRLSTESPSSAVPPSSTEQLHQKNNGEEEEYPGTIPCEVCGKNIPIPDFVEHEKECDPWSFFPRSPTPPHTPSDLEGQQGSPQPFHSQFYSNSSTFGGSGNQLPPYEHLYGNTENQGESVLCGACNQYIPLAQMQSHKSTCGSLLKQKKSSHPTQVFEDAEDSLIPCQFCSQSFAASALQGHQERCMADTQPFSHNDMSPWEPSSSTPVDIQDVCDIPCEYCGSTVPAQELSEHQATCDQNPLVKIQQQAQGRKGAGNTTTAGHSNDGKRQCPYCHKSFSAVVFKNHKTLCPKKPASARTKYQPVSSVPRREEPLGVADPSCYHCGMAYPREALRRHEAECLRNPVNTPSSRYEETHSYFGSDTLSGYGERRRSPERQPWLQEDQRSSPLERRGLQPGDSDRLPCEFCGECFAIAHVYSHQATCPRNPDLKVGPPSLEPMHSSEDDSSFTIPCEICGQQQSVSQVYTHQVQCQVHSRKGSTQYEGTW